MIRDELLEEPVSVDDRGPFPLTGATTSVRCKDGTEVHRPLAMLRADQVLAGKPWRVVRSRRGQRHFSGLYWSATTSGHVVYESRLELARLLLADFDPTVVAIAAQPFRIHARVDGRLRRHVPDFLLVYEDGSVTVVNVKPTSKLSDPKIVEALSWPAQLIEGHGWAHEIWTGEGQETLLANVRFLAAARRPELVSAEAESKVLSALVPGDTVRTLTFRLAGVLAPDQVKPVVLSLLWRHRLTTDMGRVVDEDSVLRGAA
ncbi:TnsA-like heteromeric transposase endonuclease subunit [Nonomuraea sp. NPDC050451]|uniref:TnsA-like heteromeric transposase endonuclease subunit n=1 Tax=Nonomuraea sp. NPDC050451 TaxID=3364364 RepID=UPI0037AD7B96